MDDSPLDDSDGFTQADSPGKSPFASGSPSLEYYLPPRLGIIHLLAWTAATAVLLKFSLAMEMLGETGGGWLPEGTNVFQQIVGFIYSTAFAAGIVGAGILLRGKIRRAPGRLQPGHWLLLIAVLGSLLFLLWWALYALAVAPGVFGPFRTGWIFLVFALEEIICSGMYLAGALACRHSSRWTFAFATLAVVTFIRGAWYLGMYFGVDLIGPFSASIPFSSLPLASILVGLVLLLVVLVDLRRGPRRDWLHWLGVAIAATAVAMSVAWWAWLTFAIRLIQLAPAG